MTQASLPQQGHQDDALSPDSGPYSAYQWGRVWSNFLTSDPSQGPIGLTGDTTLEVANPSGTTITVQPGPAMVSGRYFNNETEVTFSPPAAAAQPRIDVVVVVQNESVNPVTDGVASGQPLIFPADLSDYGGAAAVPPYSARLAILRGVEAVTPVAPALDQDPTTLHMIPLAEYQMTTTPSIAALTDKRVYTVSAGGGAVYVPEYYTEGAVNEAVPNAYNGRARIIPMYLTFDFQNGQTQANISFPSRVGIDLYASFFSYSINEIALGIRVSVIWGYTGNMFLICNRHGYVDDAGNPQPADTSADQITIFGLLTQLLDQPPLF